MNNYIVHDKSFLVPSGQGLISAWRRVSNPWYCWRLGLGGSLLGGALCTVECSAASLTSAYQIPVSTYQLWLQNRSPDIAKCLLWGELVPHGEPMGLLECPVLSAEWCLRDRSELKAGWKKPFLEIPLCPPRLIGGVPIPILTLDRCASTVNFQTALRAALSALLPGTQLLLHDWKVLCEVASGLFWCHAGEPGWGIGHRDLAGSRCSPGAGGPLLLDLWFPVPSGETVREDAGLRNGLSSKLSFCCDSAWSPQSWSPFCSLRTGWPGSLSGFPKIMFHGLEVIDFIVMLLTPKKFLCFSAVWSLPRGNEFYWVNGWEEGVGNDERKKFWLKFQLFKKKIVTCLFWSIFP